MRYKIITPARLNELGRITPKAIREQLIGGVTTKHLVVADALWAPGNIDLQVGHVALLPANAVVEGAHVKVLDDLPAGRLVRAEKPGLARVFLEGASWARFVRVSRSDFQGRSLYRHLEDPDVD